MEMSHRSRDAVMEMSPDDQRALEMQQNFQKHVSLALRWLHDDDIGIKELNTEAKVQYLAGRGFTVDEITEALKLSGEIPCSSTATETSKAPERNHDRASNGVPREVGLDELRQQLVQAVRRTGGHGLGCRAEDEFLEEEARIEELKWQIMQALLRMKGHNTGHPDGPAHVWHSNRRTQLLNVPAVKALIRDCNVGLKKELLVSGSTAITVICLHILLGRALSSFATTAASWQTALAVFVASGTFGAQCAYLLQALNHELGHGANQVNLPSTGRRIVFLACFTLGSIGAALCHVPWTVYYMGGGHIRHHRYVGSARDVDEDALFVLYQPRFPGVVKRLCWLSAAAILVPVLMFVSLCRCAMFDFKSNRKELTLATLHFILSGFAHYKLGFVGAVYLSLSSWFSMGFMCHPLVGFWILQHLCVSGAQPTASYTGSWLWNMLCLNELLHVEHHDLASVAWRHLPRLAEIAPEFYGNLHAETSIISLIGAWASGGSPGGDPRFSWDFACRTEWGYTRLDAAHQASAAATADAIVKQAASGGRCRIMPASAASPSPARARLRRPASEAQNASITSM